MVQERAKRIAVILAGGQSRRFGGEAKVGVMLGGERLIDRVVARLALQVDQLFLVGTSDFGTGLPLIADDPAFQGPAAGVFGAGRALANVERAPKGFVAVPVDTPFLPRDLVERLCESPAQSAVAADETRLHPSCAYWAFAALEQSRLDLPSAPSLHALAEATSARAVCWPTGDMFFNINTRADLSDANARLDEHG